MTTATTPRSAIAPNAPSSAVAVKRRPFPLVRHSMSLAKRSLIKTMRTPEALIDVTLQPAIFLVIFVYIFGGAVAGHHPDVPAVPAPGHPGADDRDGRHRHRRQPQHRHGEGHLRPLQVAAHPAVGAAGRFRVR